MEFGCSVSGTGGGSGTPGVALSATYDGQVRATWQDQTNQSLFLAGCGTVQLWRCKGTSWNEQKALTTCSSVEVEVAAGATYSDPDSLPAALAGWYFVSGSYGLGCTPGKALYSAGCATFLTASSDVIFVPAAAGSDSGTADAAGSGGASLDGTVDSGGGITLAGDAS